MAITRLPNSDSYVSVILCVMIKLPMVTEITTMIQTVNAILVLVVIRFRLFMTDSPIAATSSARARIHSPAFAP